MNAVRRVDERLKAETRHLSLGCFPSEAALLLRSLRLLKAALRDSMDDLRIDGDRKSVDRIEEDLVLVQRLLARYEF